MKKGKVFLVGAGPGDPGLITVHGRECLRFANVVLYDNLCNPTLLKEAPSHAKIVFAGKHAGARSLSQKQIESLLVRYAKAGNIVIRLKGGDPFLFGRGAEEAEHLRKHRIPFEIVPGITSAIAVPAYAGIPVTHRHHASSVAMITAHENPRKPEETLDYPSLAKFPGSLVVLMAVKSLNEVSCKLVAAGKSAKTPVAVIQSGTRGTQRTVTGRLGDIVQRVRKANIKPPALAIIGDVVKCRKQLKWFENRPLFGKRIVVTRTREQSSVLARKLFEWGAEVIELPTIEIKEVKSLSVQKAAHRAGEWDWVIFTSPLGVKFFLDSVLREHRDLRVFRKTKFAVIGPETGAKLRERGLDFAMQAKVHTSEGLAQSLKKFSLNWKNQKVLLPRSEIAQDIIEKSLRRLGADVHPLTIYQNHLPKLSWELEALQRIGADIGIFASSSAVENFWKLLNDRKRFPFSKSGFLKSCRFISIGPMTSARMQKRGIRVDAEAKTHTIEGLLTCIENSCIK